MRGQYFWIRFEKSFARPFRDRSLTAVPVTDSILIAKQYAHPMQPQVIFVFPRLSDVRAPN